MSVDAFARVALSTTTKVFSSSVPSIEQLKTKCAAAGADPEQIAYCLASFSAFIAWAAASHALQSGKLSTREFEILMKSSESLIQSVEAEVELWGAIEAGLDSFVSLTGENHPSEVLDKICDRFCDMAGNPTRPIKLKLIAQSEYLHGEKTLFDLIRRTKLV